MAGNSASRVFQKPTGNGASGYRGPAPSQSPASISSSGSKLDVLKIDDKAQQALLHYMKGAFAIRDEGFNLRDRLETIDRAYILENDFTEEQQKAKRANKNNDPTKLQNMKVPMMMESIEATVSFLTSVYLTDYPIFKFGSQPDKEELALMWNTLVGEDQVHFGWAGELAQAFRQGAKYNIAPIEVDWTRKIQYKITNGEGANGAKLEEQLYAGNALKSLDVYNTIYDPRVPIHKVHEEGEFAGYIKQMSRIKLKEFLATLGDMRLRNDKAAFESTDWDISYYTPMLNPSVTTRNKNWADGAFNWVTWATGNAQNHIAYRNMYTVCVLYAKLMPFEFGVQAPRDQTPDVWKLVSVNNVLVYAQPIPNAHNYLPIVICQPLVDNIGHQTKSQGENALPFQQMTSSMLMAAQSVARRLTVDRMLYNPLLVDPDHINSPNPGAKIPMRPTAYGRKLEEAVYKIPFDHSGTEMFMQQAQVISEWGMRANGQNRPSVGQFQKGNKLKGEWEQTMSSANAQQRGQAIMWESFGFQPIKDILKSNYLQFAPSGERYNRAAKEVVKVDIATLRQEEGDFEMGDGLLPIERLMHSDVATEAFQAMAANPGIGSAYELGPMFTYLMELKGVDKLKQFEKDPQQLAYSSQLQQWVASAMEIAIAVKDPAQAKAMMELVIGPKPLSPQEQQAAQQKQQQAQQGMQQVGAPEQGVA